MAECWQNKNIKVVTILFLDWPYSFYISASHQKTFKTVLCILILLLILVYLIKLKYNLKNSGVTMHVFKFSHTKAFNRANSHSSYPECQTYISCRAWEKLILPARIFLPNFRSGIQGKHKIVNLFNNQACNLLFCSQDL